MKQIYIYIYEGKRVLSWAGQFNFMATSDFPLFPEQRHGTEGKRCLSLQKRSISLARFQIRKQNKNLKVILVWWWAKEMR